MWTHEKARRGGNILFTEALICFQVVYLRNPRGISYFQGCVNNSGKSPVLTADLRDDKGGEERYFSMNDWFNSYK